MHFEARANVRAFRASTVAALVVVALASVVAACGADDDAGSAVVATTATPSPSAELEPLEVKCRPGEVIQDVVEEPAPSFLESGMAPRSPEAALEMYREGAPGLTNKDVVRTQRVDRPNLGRESEKGASVAFSGQRQDSTVSSVVTVRHFPAMDAWAVTGQTRCVLPVTGPPPVITPPR